MLRREKGERPGYRQCRLRPRGCRGVPASAPCVFLFLNFSALATHKILEIFLAVPIFFMDALA
jgi:hypothetical protein